MQKSETIGELAKALAKAQGAIQPAPRDTDNPFFKSKYADLPAVWRACREPLASNGLSVVQMPVDGEAGRVALTTMLLHTSGEYITSTVSTKVAKDDPQSVGSALTYLRRYALAAMVGIVADDDDDGNAASTPPQQVHVEGASREASRSRDEASEVTPYCNTHRKQMRQGRNGWYCPTKDQAGNWCKEGNNVR